MINGKTILAVITARGGSKGVPGKNIKPLCGKPLIAWTVEAAKNSRYIDRVIVTTDSPDIIKISKRYGAEAPFVRPAEISGDLAKQEDAILHAMRWMEQNDKKYDYITVLVPTTPLRDADEIDKVTEYFDSHPKARAVMTVIACNYPPLFTNMLKDDLSMRDFVPYELRLKNRQELPTYYQLSGSVCICGWDYFLEQGSFLAPETYAYVTTARKGHDINTPMEFRMAELYLQAPKL